MFPHSLEGKQIISTSNTQHAPLTGTVPWNQGGLVGQKPPLELQEIWAIRLRLQQSKRLRDLALFDLAIDSKLRGCHLVGLRVQDVAHGNPALARDSVVQRKTGCPVRFALSEQTRQAVQTWIDAQHSLPDVFCSWIDSGSRKPL